MFWQMETWYRFLVTSGCLHSRKVWWAVQISSFWAQIEVFYRPERTRGGTTWKWIWVFKFRNLNFQIQKWMLQTIRVDQIDEKDGVICLFSVFPFWVMVLKLSKKVHFLQFCADLSKWSEGSKAIFIYASERSCYILSENGIVRYALMYCLRYISIWSQRILLNFCWVSIFFDIFNPYYLMNSGSDPL